MEALGNMLAYGWPLALAGFALGAIAGGFLSERKDGAEAGPAPDKVALAELAEELKKARALLNAEEEEAVETAEALSALEEAIKRANGRLKLMAKAIRKGQ